MKEGLLFYQQGWTDIVNQLPLINYYITKYEKLTVILRPDAKPIYEFYLSNINNLNKVYDPITHTSRVNPSFYTKFDPNKFDYLLHGKLDNNRLDKYKNVFMSTPFDEHFGKKFYTCYDIDYNNKINFFNFNRNIDMENNFYEKFIKQHGENYILYHDNLLNDSSITFKKHETVKYINLNGSALDMFYMIKILQNAKEIHCVDSVWASFCYMIDAKYNLLKNVNIYLYPFNYRCGGLLKEKFSSNKLQPVSLDNWSIIK